DSLCSNPYNFIVQSKIQKKDDDKSFKRCKSTRNIATDYNNSLASIEELLETLRMYSICIY
ncbi:7297_t:CDS:1, partial [Entrophospora sp. SA101]